MKTQHIPRPKSLAESEGLAEAESEPRVEAVPSTEPQAPSGRPTTGGWAAPDLDHVRWLELAIGAAALLGWFVAFLGGTIIDTTPYRSGLLQGPMAWLVVFGFWTITNVGLLACLAATLGAFGRRTQFTRGGSNQESRQEEEPTKAVFLFYSSAILRGFGIYVLMFAGLLVLATETLEAPTQAKYLRLAATLSVMSFYAGYDPETFGSVLGRVRRMFEGS